MLGLDVGATNVLDHVRLGVRRSGAQRMVLTLTAGRADSPPIRDRLNRGYAARPSTKRSQKRSGQVRRSKICVEPHARNANPHADRPSSALDEHNNGRNHRHHVAARREATRLRQKVLVVERTQCCCYQRRDHFCRNTQTNAATSQPRPIHGIRETNVHTAALIRHNSMAKAPTSMFPMNSLDYSFCSRENVRCGLTLSSAVPEGQPLKRRAGR